MSSDTPNPLTESSITIPSDSEQYSGHEDISVSPPSSNSPPLILYSPPSVWGLIRGAAINLILPFINGMMLGFGELFAHEAAFRLGWGGTRFSSFVQNAPIRGNALLSKHTPLYSNSYARLRIPHTDNILRNINAIRFASTTPITSTVLPSTSTSTSGPSVDPTIAQPVSTPTDFTSTIDFSAEHLYNLPEQIGYLKSLGLDYGWGATSMMEYVLEHIHIYAGTPWWLSITLTAVFVRVVLFKPYIDASELSARMASIKHITDPIRANITAATRNRDVHATQQHRLELQKVMKRANIKVWKGFTPILQGVAGYGLFFTLRGMAHLPVPGLETGGILWFQNLTVMDPYLLLPIATAGLMHRMIKAGGETGVSTMTPTVQKYIMYGLPAITMIFTWHLPAGIQLSFFVSAILSAGQAYLLRTSWFRKFMNMTPLPTRPEPASIPAVYRVVTPPSSTAPPGSPPPAPLTGLRGIINKIPGKKTLDGTVKDIMATYQGGKEAGQKKMDGYREKQEKQEAEKYEAKRREDLKRERREWEDRKRMERARREKRR